MGVVIVVVGVPPVVVGTTVEHRRPTLITLVTFLEPNEITLMKITSYAVTRTIDVESSILDTAEWLKVIYSRWFIRNNSLAFPVIPMYLAPPIVRRSWTVKMSGIQVSVLLQIMFQLMVAGQVYGNMTLPSVRNSSLAVTTDSPVLPSGYIEFPEFEAAYKWFDTQLSYSDARRMCLNDNGKLAVVDSREKFEKIVNQFKNISYAWVGLLRDESSHGWITIDGKPTNNLPWGFAEPSRSFKCGFLWKMKDGLGNGYCPLVHEYLCEIAVPNVTLSSDQNSSLAETTDSWVLPSDYIAFPEFGFAYKMSYNILSHNEARKMCLKDNGQLAVIDSREKLEKIVDQFRNIDVVWVGLRHHQTLDEWITIDGKSTNNLPWAFDEPSRYFECGSLWKSRYGLVSRNCDLLHEYLCEVALPNVTLPSIRNSSLAETTKSPVLPSGYVTFPEFGAAYKWVGIEYSFSDAKRICLNDNGRLAVLDSREKIGQIVNHFKYIGLVWLGLYHHEALDKWLTIDGMITNNLPLASGEPSGNNRCGFLRETRDGIGNGDCALSHEYLCEIALPNVTLPSIQNSSLVETNDSRILPSGYVKFPEYGAAYKLFETELSYNDARKMCLIDSGQLAVIDSREKFGKIVNHFENASLVWVGLCRYQPLDEWTTIDGKSTSNLPWASGEPSGNYRCGFLWKTRDGLSNANCFLKHKYLCEIALPNVTLPSISNSSLAERSDSPVLPSGYDAFPEFGVAYKLTKTLVSHNEAREKCLNDGGQLAVIDTREKIEKIRENVYSFNWAWVGVGRFFDADEWITIDGKSTNNLPWADTQPKNSARCAVLAMLDNGLSTSGCWSLKNYLCEIALPRN